MKNAIHIKFTSGESSAVYDNGKLLSYATLGSSGFDLRAVAIFEGTDSQNNLDTSFILKPNNRCLIKTGISTAIPQNTEIQVRPRSGLALKHGITVVNTPGTVDSDYRGEVGVILLNTSDQDFQISKGDRIAQAVLCPILKAEFNIVDDLDETMRSSGGFGSTGK